MMMKFIGQMTNRLQEIDIPVRFLILQVFILTLFLFIIIF